ncbi:tyrosine-type recombinase/integrase [Candidatus Bathyarchaeota archaeon]|nr:tyrosine-type recombinase/integrase [Candidatus Bathyarchaeota archaeon]
MNNANGAYKIWMRHTSNKAAKTKLEYQKNFKHFLEWCRKTPDELRQLKLQEESQKEPWLRTEVENLVREHVGMMKKKNYSGSSIHMRLCAIRSFFKAQNLPLHLNRDDQPIIDNLKAKGTPSKKQLKEIIECADNLRDRALMLFLKDTGLRASDVPQILWKHLTDVGDGFSGFKIVTVKRRVVARGFIGSEASEALARYKRERLQGSKNVKPESNIEDHALFTPLPESGHYRDGTEKLGSNAIGHAVHRAVVLAGFPNKFSSHSLRKFWEQSMRAPREAYLKQLNGRSLNATERAYYWRTEEQLLELYKENYDNLRVLGSLIKHSEIDAIVEERLAQRRAEQTKEIERLNQEVEKLRAERLSQEDVEKINRILKMVDEGKLTVRA